MLKNYFNTARRNLLRHKLYSLINILGLAVGLTACILIALFVRDETGYDSFWADADRTFRIETVFGTPGREPSIQANSSGPLKEGFETDYPDEIEAATRFFRQAVGFRNGDLEIEEELSLVDPGFFDVFDIAMVSGDRNRVFDDNLSVILSKDMAIKYFGRVDVVGEVLVADPREFKIVAVLENLPHKTHLKIDFLALFDTSRYVNQPWVATMWMTSNLFTYVKLVDPERADLLMADFPDFLDRHVDKEQEFYFSGNEDLKPSELMSASLMPLGDIHLHSRGASQIKPVGDIRTVTGFSLIAIVILFIATINFMNLTSARASQRAREVVLRKVVGASRKRLILQYLGESMLLAALALLIAVPLVEAILPWYENFLGTSLILSPGDPVTLIGMFAVVAFAGLVGGLYPAFVLSAFKPVDYLGGGRAGDSGSARFRSLLVVVQFAASIALIVSTAVISNQISYTQTKDLGFDKDLQLVLDRMNQPEAAAVADTIRVEIEKLPGVRGSAFSSRSVPLRGSLGLPMSSTEGDVSEQVTVEQVRVGYDFLDVYGANLMAGRLFSSEFSGDLRSQPDGEDGDVFQSGILSERAAQALGFKDPEDAVGKVVRFDFRGTIFQNTIVGVVRDMHLRSLRSEIEPMIFLPREAPLRAFTVNISPTDIPGTLAAIDAIWGELVPGRPIQRFFVDENLAALYQADERQGVIFSYFAILAVMVSALGLFGLVVLTAERRTKEIGIRKVLGAGVHDIVRLLTWQFTKPVLLANIIAWPVAWYYMREWLDGFAYRIELSPVFFIGAGLVALLIAWATVSSHAFRVARTNPIHALRYE